MDIAIRPFEGGTAFGPTIDHATAAEDYGFDAVYMAEHHGYPRTPYWPSPLLGLAGLATRTDTIRLGTNVAVLPLYDPVRLAGTLAHLQTMAESRLRVGFGVGWREAEFEALGIPYAERGRRMNDGLRALHALFEDGPTTYAGEFVSIDEFELTPAVAERPELWVGGRSGPAVRRAADLADGWMAPSGPIERHHRLLDEYRANGGERVAVNTNGVIVRENEAAVERAVREYTKYRNLPYVRGGKRDQYATFANHLEARGIDLPRDTEAAAETYAEKLAEFHLRDGLEAYLAGQMFVAGTPDQCIDQLDRLTERTSCDEIVLRLHVHGWPVAESTRTLELLGEAVLPSF